MIPPIVLVAALAVALAICFRPAPPPRRPGPPLDFDNIKNGQVLSGNVVVYIDVNDPDYHRYSEDSSVTVDPVADDCAWFGVPSNGVAQKGPGGIDLWRTAIPTDEIPNGTHTLAVGITNRPPFARRTVVIRNASWIQSTAPGGLFDRTISATYFPAQPWTVTIDLRGGKRVYHGSGSSFKFVWDGNDAKGRLVPHEEYPVEWTLTLKNGKTAWGGING